MTAAIVTLNATIGEIEELLAAGKTVEDVARELQEPRPNVLAVWHRMRNIRQDITAPAPSPIRSGTLTVPATPEAAPPIASLLTAAERSTSARTRTLGSKLADLVLELRRRLADERDVAEAAAKQQAEREAAVAEVARLEAELAAARQKAGVAGKRRGGSGTVPREKKPLTDSQRERLAKMRAAQVGEWPCRKECGQVSKTPSGRAAHERFCTAGTS